MHRQQPPPVLQFADARRLARRSRLCSCVCSRRWRRIRRCASSRRCSCAGRDGPRATVWCAGGSRGCIARTRARRLSGTVRSQRRGQHGSSPRTASRSRYAACTSCCCGAGSHANARSRETTQAVDFVSVAPLTGVRIAVTRAEGRSGPLVDALRAAGATVTELPLTRIESLDPAPLANALSNLRDYAWILLTSEIGRAHV